MNKLTRERLAAIEAYVADKDAKNGLDFAEASTAAGHLSASSLHRSQRQTPAKLAEIHGKFIERGRQHGDRSRRSMCEPRATTEKLDTSLTTSSSEEGAWAALEEKFREEPAGRTAGKDRAREVAQIDAMVAQIGTDPKAFSVKDIEGKDLSLEALKGKVVLLDFWATWCGPCVQELPNVIAAYKKYHSKGFEIVGISLDDEDKTSLDKFLAGTRT